jgi:branched-chain amino acid aminotransferase
MANIYTNTLIDGEITPKDHAAISITSSAVLYGLSVYTVFSLKKTDSGWLVFRLPEHLARLQQSGRLIGLTLKNITPLLELHTFTKHLSALLEANQPATDQFCRLTIHVSAEVPGVHTRDLSVTLSAFLYDASPILPTTGARIKTSLWRRTADTAIPARAKVNGAYVNSALAKQEALDCGFDDCLFLNQNGYVSELSTANIFLVKQGELITPDLASDILEGITRRSIIEIARENGIHVTERKVALTELYTADEVFACGTSANVSRIIEIDKRAIENNYNTSVVTTLHTQLSTIQSKSEHPWTSVL